MVCLRYAFTIMSNLFVYGVTFFLLKFHQKEGKQDDDDNIT